ncbi:MAG: hypothetical protein DRH44_00500 [Candidatus Coatesbacteria bacterium]|nr:MAG: hypothetical protein DRH44_00500 [Candidatus Coatesbacteria bacterium]
MKKLCIVFFVMVVIAFMEPLVFAEWETSIVSTKSIVEDDVDLYLTHIQKMTSDIDILMELVSSKYVRYNVRSRLKLINSDIRDIRRIIGGGVIKRWLPMSEDAFDKLIATLEEASFEDDMLNILRGISSNNYFTCSQVKRIMDVFEFSEGKISAFSILYKHIIDPENISVVYTSLDFSSDKDRISEIIEDMSE